MDLDLGYSNTLALYQLMSYVTGYEFNVESGALVNLKDESIQYAVLSPCLYHTNLSLIYHSIFFQMCKAHFIGYDPAVSDILQNDHHNMCVIHRITVELCLA